MSWQRYDTAASFFVASTDEAGLRLHLRAHGADDPARPPVLFVHGATYASRLFDIPHPRASWLKAMADAGFAAYALDIRGYGKSRSTEMTAASRPYATGSEAIRDIADAVAWILRRHACTRLALVGGSWGSITTARFTATIGQDTVERLVLYAPIFAERNDGWLQYLADPDQPMRLNAAFGAARLVTEADTRARWDAEIPDGADWREEDVLQALWLSSLADDPQGGERSPAAFRAPNGTLQDLWEAFHGRLLYDPAAITCPVLLIRGGADPTSTRSDALNLFDALGSEIRHYVEIANAAHFASAERRASEVFASTTAFVRTL